MRTFWERQCVMIQRHLGRSGRASELLLCMQLTRVQPTRAHARITEVSSLARVYADLLGTPMRHDTETSREAGSCIRTASMHAADALTTYASTRAHHRGLVATGSSAAQVPCLQSRCRSLRRGGGQHQFLQASCVITLKFSTSSLL